MWCLFIPGETSIKCQYSRKSLNWNTIIWIPNSNNKNNNKLTQMRNLRRGEGMTPTFNISLKGDTRKSCLIWVFYNIPQKYKYFLVGSHKTVSWKRFLSALLMHTIHLSFHWYIGCCGGNRFKETHGSIDIYTGDFMKKVPTASCALRNRLNKN